MTMVGSALRAGATPRIFASIAQESLFDTMCLMGEHLINIARSVSVKKEQRVGLIKLLYSFIKYLKYAKLLTKVVNIAIGN